jgi:hypothetical protein
LCLNKKSRFIFILYGPMLSSSQFVRIMKPNGPAVCFSKRNPTTALGRILVPRASGARKLSRCKEGLARVFAVNVQSLLSITRVAVQVLSEPQIYHRLQILLRALAQCRDTKLIEAKKLSRCIGALLDADSSVRVQEPLLICLEGRS